MSSSQSPAPFTASFQPVVIDARQSAIMFIRTCPPVHDDVLHVIGILIASVRNEDMNSVVYGSLKICHNETIEDY
jgi:hypothetical protein